ncbi:MAG: OmpA family protein [Cocleimonas sp.]
MKKTIALPLLLCALTISACSSQRQNEDNKGSVSSVINKGSKAGNKTNSGTISKNGASNVNSSETRGKFNYLPGSNNGAGNKNAKSSHDISLAGLSDPNNLLSQRIIYFDYDKAAIRPEYMILIQTHAKLLAKFPDLKMRLEGHADERGSREYNVALSESRARSVKSIMGVHGAQGRQIKSIGFGEEVPIVSGHSKNSWQKNRRVEIKYDNY